MQTSQPIDLPTRNVIEPTNAQVARQDWETKRQHDLEASQKEAQTQVDRAKMVLLQRQEARSLFNDLKADLINADDDRFNFALNQFCTLTDSSIATPFLVRLMNSTQISDRKRTIAGLIGADAPAALEINQFKEMALALLGEQLTTVGGPNVGSTKIQWTINDPKPHADPSLVAKSDEILTTIYKNKKLPGAGFTVWLQASPLITTTLKQQIQLSLIQLGFKQYGWEIIKKEKMPKQSEVRFFKGAGKSTMEAVNDLVKLLKASSLQNCISKPMVSGKDKTIELWVP